MYTLFSSQLHFTVSELYLVGMPRAHWFISWKKNCCVLRQVTHNEVGSNVRQREKEKEREAGGLQLDHSHRGHSNAISFPMQSHNLMAQTFSLITHLGNAPIPFHFISSNQSHIINEYTQTRRDIWLGNIVLGYQGELLHYCPLRLPVYLFYSRQYSRQYCIR